MTTVEPAARPEVAAFVDRLARLDAQRRQAEAAMRAATGTATSADAAVTAEVDAEGILVALSFGAAADPASPALPQQVMDTVRRAHRQALDRAAEAVASAAGPDNPAVAVLRRRSAGLRDDIDVPAVRRVPGGGD